MTMCNADIETATFEMKEIADVLNTFPDTEISNDIKNKIIHKLTDIAVSAKDILNGIANVDIEEESDLSEDKPDKMPKVKKQWALLVSDPNNTISGDYMGWPLQMDETENISDLTDKIILAAGEFNRSKKGSKNPVNTIGEALMYVPSKFFKEQKIYNKSKEPVYITLTNNKLVSTSNV